MTFFFNLHTPLALYNVPKFDLSVKTNHQSINFIYAYINKNIIGNIKTEIFGELW